MIIVKGTTFADSWGVYHFPGMGNTHGLLLNSDVAEIDSVTYWNDTTASASVFSLGNDTMINKTGQTMLAYCFHSVEGYSKVGSYTGNGASQDGTFVYCGFKPAFLLVKNVSSSAWWGIWDDARDPYNTITYEGYPNSNVAEGNNTGSTNGPGTFDFTANGFKGRRKAAESMTNTSGDTYMYLAIAESPFKTSNAR